MEMLYKNAFIQNQSIIGSFRRGVVKIKYIHRQQKEIMNTEATLTVNTEGLLGWSRLV